MLFVELVHKNAQAPVRSSTGAAGYDISACIDHVVPANGWTVVPTGIKIKIPDNVYGRIAPRSGLSLRGICVGAGVIDSDYRGEVGVVLYNHASSPYVVKTGNRIAQLILEHIDTPDVKVVSALSEDTERGSHGYGSTGR